MCSPRRSAISHAARISSALHSEVPQYRALPAETMSLIARTVSSIGVSGSARWQNTRSTKSSPKRSSDSSMADRRYFRFKVFFMLTSSWMPQKSLVETT